MATTINQNALAIVAKRMGADLLPDIDTIWTNRMQIRSSSSTKLYIVSQNRNTGEWGCTCFGYKNKRPGKPRGCKHLTIMVPLLENAAHEAVKTFQKGR